MIYLYDNAIVQDLEKSFNTVEGEKPVVRVVDPESIVSLAAQIQEDAVAFPVVAVYREPNLAIDTDRTNFTWQHRGVQSVIDPETNELYYEKTVPVKLSYKLSILTTNTADMDEIVRELLFKYLNMYFLTLTLPYECKRKVRFGLIVDQSGEIERVSSTHEYLHEGKLYETVLPLRCEGAVLVSYTPAKLHHYSSEVEDVFPGSENLI